jgi:hypothetical protein
MAPESTVPVAFLEPPQPKKETQLKQQQLLLLRPLQLLPRPLQLLQPLKTPPLQVPLLGVLGISVKCIFLCH